MMIVNSIEKYSNNTYEVIRDGDLNIIIGGELIDTLYKDEKQFVKLIQKDGTVFLTNKKYK